MIPVSPAACQDAFATDLSWQTALQQVVTDPLELCALLGLTPEDSTAIAEVCERFALRVPLPYLARIARGNPRDPLLLQVLPQAQELLDYPGFSADPLAEADFNPVPGLIHKYQSRVLLVATGHCAINCRYCFRREFPYEAHQNSRADWQRALDYLRDKPDINEVILSGGDPLSVSDKLLGWFIEQLAALPHIVRLRIHSRLPIVIPQRVTDELCQLLSQSRLQAVVVVHANHPQEIDQIVGSSLLKLRNAGVTCLNQSVLLKGINDNVDDLTHLGERLFAYGCIPYYLHVLDHVRGSRHFLVDDAAATALHQQLKQRLAGFLVPKLVRELPGEPSKTWLS